METPADTIKSAFKRHSDVLAKSLTSILPEAQRAAEILAETAKNGRRLLVCGNGGSAADSQHLAAEWVCKYKKDRKALDAIALTVNTSVLTAIGNDYGFEYVFKRQIEAFGRKGDVLVAITTSGTSKNILAAIAQAKSQGIKVILLTGEGGKETAKTVDLGIVVPSSETARIQEMHELIYHAWCEYVDSVVA
jgi:D-sedoheptulose 7-phosphate isomerase